MLWPHERSDPYERNLLIIHNTFPVFVRQRFDPLEPGFFKARLFRLLGVVSDSPDYTGHLGDFVYATGETNCDYLLYGPRFSGSRRPRHKKIVGGPYRDEK